MANYFKSILRFGIDPVLKKHKNIIPYITEGKGFFITFDYSFLRLLIPSTTHFGVKAKTLVRSCLCISLPLSNLP